MFLRDIKMLTPGLNPLPLMMSVSLKVLDLYPLTPKSILSQDFTLEHSTQIYTCLLDHYLKV